MNKELANEWVNILKLFYPPRSRFIYRVLKCESGYKIVMKEFYKKKILQTVEFKTEGEIDKFLEEKFYKQLRNLGMEKVE